MKLTYLVTKQEQGKPLSYLLKNTLFISARLLIRLKKDHCIFVNHTLTYVNELVKERDIVLIDFSLLSSSNSNVIPYSYPLDILYEDDYLLAVNKPANMESHPSMNNFDQTLANAVQNYFMKNKKNHEKIHLITRLDKNTSGICLIAKNEYIQELFIAKKQHVQFNKQYIAIVNGIITNAHDIIEANIMREPNSIITRCVNERGDYAKTEYEVLKRNEKQNFSILNVTLHTGRTHQIRVHLSYLGHPILGDDLYGGNQSRKDLISRQALHSSNITFFHPITEKFISLFAPLPPDMEKLMS